MKTKQLYLSDSYLKQADAKVAEIEQNEKITVVYLDQTIFYAQGGGQPADIGIIAGKNGTLTVSHVSYNNGKIQHKGMLSGTLEENDVVTLTIDWKKRYENMQLHTAGHVLDQAVKNIIPNVYGVDGTHGIQGKNYIEFNEEIKPDQLPQIQKEIENICAAGEDITTQMVTHAEIKAMGIHLPFDLPKNKDLRIMSIGSYPAMPDGGTQLKNTGECWPISVDSVQEKKNLWRVQYSVKHPQHKKSPESIKKKKEEHLPLVSLEELKVHATRLEQEVKADVDEGSPDLHTKYLGKNGLFNQLAKTIKDIGPAERKQAGMLLNQVKAKITAALKQTTTKQQHSAIDLTMPGTAPHVGHLHPVTQAMREITDIFEQIGFTRVRYPEVDWDWYVFESLNMPPHHPARDEWETFFVDVPDTTKDVAYDSNNPRKRHPSLVGGKVVLTTHTSNGQVREMERMDSTPPIRFINIARCYRRQQDATHTQMFHQFEGLVIDKHITIQHLKGTLDHFAQHFYGPTVKSRIRPFHFQFTEPSFEVDFSCHICDGTGVVNGEKCKFCKSGWHEVGGAGMVHPNVLKAGGIDPDIYTGFAFGWGVERTYTLKPGLNIDDIRLLYSSNIQFLEQF
ncbi:MAG: phenylalanine--tRNA ligase subunit alpha [Pseudomonadales bacterium]|nr:phenylalanine--tRNA ligase subunit alpha [Pseudomonadales bacterium]